MNLKKLDKKVLLIFLVISGSILIISCGGGGGAGSPFIPPSPGSGDDITVNIYSSKATVPINGSATILVRVINKYGNGVSGKTVNFTATNGGILSNNSAVTDAKGVATITVSKKEYGESNITAMVGDAMYVSTTVLFANIQTQQPTLEIKVDTNNNKIYNEIEDYTLFSMYNDKKINEPSGATANFIVYVKDIYGKGIKGKKVYIKGEENNNLTYVPANKVAYTNDVGAAFFSVTFNPNTMNSNLYYTFTFTSYDIGYMVSNSITLLSYPVALHSILAVPSKYFAGLNDTIDVNITAINKDGSKPKKVFLNIKSVETNNENKECGIVPSGIEIVDGIGQFVFYTPSIISEDKLKCKVTVYYNSSIKNSFEIEINRGIAGKIGGDLTVIPTTATVNVGESSKFIVTGGYPPYSLINLNETIISATTASNNQFIVSGLATGSGTLVLADAKGNTVSIVITVTTPTGTTMTVTPPTASMSVGDTMTFVVTGGSAPYTTISSNTSVATVTNVVNGSFTVTAVRAGTANIIVRDNNNTVVMVTITVI